MKWLWSRKIFSLLLLLTAVDVVYPFVIVLSLVLSKKPPYSCFQPEWGDYICSMWEFVFHALFANFLFISGPIGILLLGGWVAYFLVRKARARAAKPT